MLFSLCVCVCVCVYVCVWQSDQSKMRCRTPLPLGIKFDSSRRIDLSSILELGKNSKKKGTRDEREKGKVGM